MANKLTQHEAGIYQIRFQGALEETWFEYLDPELIVQVDLESPESIVTTITGKMLDQAALIGLLNNLYDLGLPLLHVQYMEL